MARRREHFPLDETFFQFRALSGIDEAGRGCLAGPVVVACVTWNPKAMRRQDWFAELADSKQITAETRERLYPKIVENAERVRVAVIHPILIDALNILGATFHGFEWVAPRRRADAPLVIDGHLRPPGLKWAQTQVKGDALLSPVSAAGVVAKVTRDALMVGLARSLPKYGFAGHKGYGTASHRQAISEWGPSAQHRKSFRPVADLVASEQPADEAFLSALSEASPDQVKWLFGEFCTHYQRFSLGAARLAVKQFSQKGLALLPSPRDLDNHPLLEPTVPGKKPVETPMSWDIPLWN